MKPIVKKLSFDSKYIFATEILRMREVEIEVKMAYVELLETPQVFRLALQEDGKDEEGEEWSNFLEEQILIRTESDIFYTQLASASLEIAASEYWDFFRKSVIERIVRLTVLCTNSYEIQQMCINIKYLNFALFKGSYKRKDFEGV